MNIAPYLGDILEMLTAAFVKYQSSKLVMIYDVMKTLADSVGYHLHKSEFINLLLPPPTIKWSSLSDDESTTKIVSHSRSA